MNSGIAVIATIAAFGLTLGILTMDVSEEAKVVEEQAVVANALLVDSEAEELRQMVESCRLASANFVRKAKRYAGLPSGNNFKYLFEEAKDYHLKCEEMRILVNLSSDEDEKWEHCNGEFIGCAAFIGTTDLVTYHETAAIRLIQTVNTKINLVTDILIRERL